MNFLRIIPILALIFLAACAQYDWKPGELSKVSLEQAEAECRALAWDNTGKTRPFGNWYEPGPSGESPDSPRAIEEREYELCMSKKGFRQVRVKWFRD